MIKAVGLNVLVLSKKEEKENKTSSGFILANPVEKQHFEGEVVSIGSRVEEVKKGQLIAFSKYSPTELEYEDKKYFAVEERDILAILK